VTDFKNQLVDVQ